MQIPDEIRKIADEILSHEEEKALTCCNINFYSLRGRIAEALYSQHLQSEAKVEELRTGILRVLQGIEESDLTTAEKQITKLCESRLIGGGK